MQLLFCTGLGLFYAVMREKTDSLVGPIAAHGASDGLLTVIQLWFL
jgi:membrane protease YdiL (CAAX protease family)